MSNNIKPSEVSDILLQQLKDINTKVKFEEVGVVLTVGDGVSRVYGLSNVTENELVQFENGVMGVAMNLEEDNVGVVLLGPSEGIKEGQSVKRTDRVASIEVSDEMLGRVINPLGTPLDGAGAIGGEKYLMPLDRKAPGVIYRQPVNQALQTGLKAVDSMIPIGRGQRELIIGDRQTGKTAVALDAIVNQKDTGVICIYVAVGQKASSVANVVRQLEQHGAMEHTIVVAATASEAAALQYIAPYSGCTMGEYFRDRGEDALIVYDDLSKQAVAYRQISLLLRRPPGREAYPGDVFYLHSRLLERAARINADEVEKLTNGEVKGKTGSLTALPIIETQAGDVSAFVPTNVISITDGQIFLETDLFNSGIRPAINAGISVSRVGGAAQTKVIKKLGGGIRLALAQYRELAAFAQFASDLDEATRKQLQHGEVVTELMKQKQFNTLSTAEMALTLWAINNGSYSDVPVNKALAFEAEFLNYVRTQHPDTLNTINESGALSNESEQVLEGAMKTFKTSYSYAA